MKLSDVPLVLEYISVAQSLDATKSDQRDFARANFLLSLIEMRVPAADYIRISGVVRGPLILRFQYFAELRALHEGLDTIPSDQVLFHAPGIGTPSAGLVPGPDTKQ